MKNFFVFLFALILLLGCETDSKLTFETKELTNNSCSNCPHININVPKAIGKSRVEQEINTAIEEELIYTFKFEDSLTINSIDDVIASFTKSYQNFKKEFDDEAINWEAKANGDVSYESQFLISILLNTYTFTGGAHGYGSATFLNFDKKKSLELENHWLFKDYERFIVLAEAKFRTLKEIPAEKNINTTGFMFSDDIFHLPENIGFTKEGLLLIYNQYEIASYADGPIEILIPFKEVNPFLKEEYQVK